MRCGKCCTLLAITFGDMFNLADAVNMEPADFFEEYCTFSTMVMPDGIHPIIRMGHRDKPCPFLTTEADGKHGCAVYKDRPLVCKMFPFTFRDAVLLGDYREVITPIGSCTMNLLRPDLVLISDKELLNEFVRGSILVGNYIREGNLVFNAQIARHYIAQKVAKCDECGAYCSENDLSSAGLCPSCFTRHILH